MSAAAIAQPAFAQSAHSPFELVLIDSASERQLGGMPPDRAVMARAITMLKEAGARGVVLKFYYDQAGKSAEVDMALAEAMGSTKTILQARMDEAELSPNYLPSRFIKNMGVPDFKTAVTGTSAWIPLEQFAAVAYDLGFADIASPDHVPMIENYQDKPVKSLTLAALELATGHTAKIDNGTRLTLGDKAVPLNDDNEVELKLSSVAIPEYVSLLSLLEAKIDGARFRDKVVVIAYDGTKMQFLTTSVGTVKSHRLFYLGLLDVYRQLK